jgi:two-component system nitrogen regulation response regulator NtrX
VSTILVVDDEPNIRRMVARLLEAEEYHTREAAHGVAALAAVEAEEPDVVLLDLAMPELDGLGTLAKLRERWPGLPVVMMSGRATLTDAVQATKLGAFHFIEKPLSPEAVLLTVRGAIELRRARDLSRTLVTELGAGQELVGTSEPMRRTRELIEQVAPTPARVLLTGESGTGKELAAVALHAHSARAAGPFVRVNSAAIPRDLVESEMFGHERGAFTGATERRRGRFELADGGTLFLDEVGELGHEAQAKLLRALESGEIERVGGQVPIRVDVRVIAATNRDLRAEVAAGRFREDLFYRLHVIPIHLPPLRARPEDIPDLVTHFLARLQLRDGLVPPSFQEPALARLRSHHWPGNVRELANICERLAILYPGRLLGAAEIAGVLPGAGGAGDGAGGGGGAGLPGLPGLGPGAALTEQLDGFERRLIEDALDVAAGNLADAARTLQTDRPNLYRRMKRLGIER